MEVNHRRPATAAPYPPCPEELENARRQPAMSTPYQQSHGHPPGDTSTPGFPHPVCMEMSDTPAHHFAGPRQEGRPAHRPAAPIQRFNSKNIGWPAWFRHFRAVADVQGWDKDQRALQMVSYLDEKAMNVAQELSDRELYDYDALVGLLSARFDPASRVSASRSRFHGRTRRHHEDADIGFDPLSANRRFSGTADLAVLRTLVFAGPTRETISVMVPDCIVPPVSSTVRVDLRHHIGLSLGPAVDMTNWSPEDNLERSLCPASLADTLGLQRRAYWDELNPILKQWKSVNNSDCQQFIKVNMGRHIRLKHSTYMCFWRCPVISCSLWFTAELNAKDHIEGIHKFKEGHGTSFYECLRRHGVEWFGSRTFFDQRKATNQAIWMDMALARRSGQELRNSYSRHLKTGSVRDLVNELRQRFPGKYLNNPFQKQFPFGLYEKPRCYTYVHA